MRIFNDPSYWLFLFLLGGLFGITLFLVDEQSYWADMDSQIVRLSKLAAFSEVLAGRY